MRVAFRSARRFDVDRTPRRADRRGPCLCSKSPDAGGAAGVRGSARDFGGLRTVYENAAAPWLILPVVICLSQRLSHACLSTSLLKVKPRKAH